MKIKELIEGTKEEIEKYFADNYEWNPINKGSDFAYENQMSKIPEEGHGMVAVQIPVETGPDKMPTVKVEMVHFYAKKSFTVGELGEALAGCSMSGSQVL